LPDFVETDLQCVRQVTAHLDYGIYRYINAQRLSERTVVFSGNEITIRTERQAPDV